MLVNTSKSFKDNKIAFVLQLCTRITWKMDSFSANQTRVIFSCILLYADREWNFGSSYGRIRTDPANSNRKGKWEVCKHAKRQKAKKALDYLSCSPYISFVFQLHAAALQQNKAFLFLNVTHLILKGGDSRLKLLSFEIFVVLGQIEPNFHYFTSYLHSAVVLRNETHQMIK